MTTNLLDQMRSCFNLHKIVEPGETDDTYYFLLKYPCYAYYHDKMNIRHALDIKRFITIGGYTVGFCMLGAICGSDITMIKKLKFLFKGQW